MRKAMFFREGKCHLCPHNCLVKEGQSGLCRVRKNIDGELYSLVYGKVIAKSIDPIEKKPLFHFMPGSLTFSFSTMGCNLRCSFCQNHEIAQVRGEIQGMDMSPEEIVKEAIDYGCKVIAYTYTEPTVYYEFALDTAKAAKSKGLRNVFVSNGFISKEAIGTISKYLDAINIDMKGDEKFYTGLCKGEQKPVLEAIREYYQRGIFVELTTLLVPGYNDSERVIREIADFIAGLDVNIPWHISRFSPHHKLLDSPPTEQADIFKAMKIGREKGIKHIYAGNLPGDSSESTYCPKCKAKIIGRYLFKITDTHIKAGKCAYCGERVNIVWD